MSLIKHEILQPVRHFNVHDDPLTNIETLHLVLWPGGLCIAGYDAEGKVLTAKAYTFPSGDIAAVESIFVNDPLVAGPQPVTHTWIAESRQLVVPAHLYEAEAAASWLSSFHFIEAGEQIRAAAVARHLPATVVYPVADKLELLLEKYFAESRTEPLSAMLLCQQPQASGSYADIVFLDQTVLLTVHSSGKMLVHRVAEMGNVHNLVYMLAAICQEYNIPQKELGVHCSGLCLEKTTVPELREFFPGLSCADTAQDILFTLLNRQLSCVS